MAEIPDTWYVSNEPREILILGVTMTIKELSADEYAQLIAQVTTKTRFDSNLYGKLLIEKMVQNPTIEDVSKLKPGIRGQLIHELEAALGISEDALKNLNSG